MSGGAAGRNRYDRILASIGNPEVRDEIRRIRPPHGHVPKIKLRKDAGFSTSG